MTEPDALVEAVSRAIAPVMGPEFDELPADRRELRERQRYSDRAWFDSKDDIREVAQAAIAAARPIIELKALERVAKVAEQWFTTADGLNEAGVGIAKLIRALPVGEPA